jgi:hypothetical protein
MKKNLNIVLFFGIWVASSLFPVSEDAFPMGDVSGDVVLEEAQKGVRHNEYHVPFQFLCKRRLEEIKRLSQRVSLLQIHEARLLWKLVAEMTSQIEEMIQCGEPCYGILSRLYIMHQEEVEKFLNDLKTMQYRIRATMNYTQSCRSRSAIDSSESVEFQPVNDSVQEGTRRAPPSWMRCFLNPSKVSGNLQSLSKGHEAATRYDELCNIYDYVTKAHDELGRAWDGIKLY